MDNVIVTPIIQQVTIDINNPSASSTIDIIACQHPQTVEVLGVQQSNAVFIQPQIIEQSVIEVGFQQGATGKDGENGIDGKQGDTGATGATGATGLPGSTYIHYQSIAASVWNIAHNLNGYPPVTILNSAEEKVEGDIKYVDLNNLTATFSNAFAGIASV